MDFKAVISNCGDEKLYKTLSSEIERRLPSTSIEWKRSYGRASKQVVLQANFLSFDPIHLSKKVDSALSLGSKPLLHIFWTACLDNDTYKSKVRNHLLRWYRQLQESGTPDWLIVHVLYQENSKTGKPKIQLPRTSVYDKIKTEFGQKLQDRCLQLWEPDKETLFTKSGESWQTLLTQLRRVLLESFGQQLDSFEDRIRVMREKYANPDWPFLSYFTVHEELALIYQSIILKEDALVQYDEVDALLSQFIINSNGRELPSWLQKFCVSPFKWDGVVLKKNAIEYYRSCIIKEDISLIEFRNYLFARQCKLLIKNKRKWEIPSRLIEFLHTVVQELRMLKIDASKAMTSCWAILTCLHFFDVLESYESKDHSFNSTMAQICDYLREKIKYIGEVTGLSYPRTQTREEMELSTKLAAGFGNLDSSSNKNENNNISPTKRLKAVLKSKTEFKQMYLEISCKCLNMLSDVKRPHFLIIAGIDLAKFYLLHGQYLDAEPLLEKAWSVYKQEKWQRLYTDVLIPLADCQLKHELYDRYLNSVTMLSSAACLSYATREYYSNELKKLANNEQLNLATIGTEPILNIDCVKIDLVKNKGHIGDTINVIITLKNELTERLCFKEICILCRHCDLSNPRSFSDHLVSPRRSIFDQTDYGLDVTLSPTEKPKETNTKEPLTPSNLLKRIKGHRRTWSRNKNIVEEQKGLDRSSTSMSEDSQKNISPSTSSHSVESLTNSKQALFSVGDSQGNATVGNGDVRREDAKSILRLARSKSEPVGMDKAEEMLANQYDGGLRRSSKVIMASDLPLATSSVSDSPKKVYEECDLKEDTSSESSSNRESVVTIEESSLFVQPEEVEENILDQVLVSEPDVVLNPGVNHVKLCAKINHEGRYVLQNIDCTLVNLKLCKLLALPQDSRSFFMVADPPKVAWTTDYVVDYLLTGSKQRLHVTLLNGPGVILDQSTLEISSSSGLHFCLLTSSSIQVFPLERDGIAREAAIAIDVDNDGNLAKLKLPYCKPYERVNIYFDAVAPVHRKAGESSMCQHDINFSCIWLHELVNTPLRLDCIFYEPFQVKFETLYKAERTLIKVTLCGVNPVPLMFSSPQLSSSNVNYTFSMLSRSAELHLFGCEESSLIWQFHLKDGITDGTEEIPCRFSVDFSTKNSDESDFGNFTQDFSVYIRKHLYSVMVEMVTNTIECSKPCRVSVVIHRNSEHDSDYRLFLMLNPEISSCWRYAGSQNYTEVLFEDCSKEVKLEILLITDQTGQTIMPPFKLLMSHEMEINFNQDNLEMFTQFPVGSVMYTNVGHTLKVRKQSNACSDV